MYDIFAFYCGTVNDFEILTSQYADHLTHFGIWTIAMVTLYAIGRWPSDWSQVRIIGTHFHIIFVAFAFYKVD